MIAIMYTSDGDCLVGKSSGECSTEHELRERARFEASDHADHLRQSARRVSSRLAKFAYPEDLRQYL